MRCLTLAEALREEGCDILFLSRDEPGNLCPLMRRRGFEVAMLDSSQPLCESDDARASADALREWSADLVVVDHYALSVEWERRAGAVTQAMMVIDDLPHRLHHCDILLDQNLHAGRVERAPLPAHCRLLLGPSHALLRPQFAENRAAYRHRDVVRSIVVSLGGGDCAEPLARIVSQLRAMTTDEAVTVVASARTAQDARLRARCDALPGCTLRSDVEDMAALLADADLAVGAGGVSSLERCCLGVPSAVVSIADNQVGPSAELARRGCQLYLGPLDGDADRMLESGIRLLWHNADLRSHLSRQGRMLVDGLGARRVAAAILNRDLSIRPAVLSDAGWMRQWRNADTARRHSHDSRPIEAHEHEAWMAAALADPHRCLLVGERRGHAVGVVRYDIDGDCALISIYLDPASIGIGIGTALLEAGERWMGTSRPAVRRFRAEIGATNEVSRRAFEKAGFKAQRVHYIKQV